MKNEVKLVFEDSKIIEVPYGTTVRDVITELADEQVIALKINGNLVSADQEIKEDVFVNYIRITDRIGRTIYMKGLEYLYLVAIKDLYGSNVVVNIKHSLDKGIYTEISMKRLIDKNVVSNIKRRMKELCDKNLPFKETTVSRKDAIDYAKNTLDKEKSLNYTYIANSTITLYELDDNYNYFFYTMPPSTKMLKRFDLVYVGGNGVVLCYPINNIVPKYNPSPKVLNAYRTYESKLENVGVKYAGELNKLLTEGKIPDFIQVNEIIYDQNLFDIAKSAAENKNIKSIFISGPSSSGKTTSSKKLALYLKTLGKDALVVSTDDYYKERLENPKKADGSYDFEIVDALDYKLFSDHLNKLLNGEEVVMPTFNFISGKKEFKNKPICLKDNQILVIEGLHAISEKVNGVIPKKNKLKIYISPFMPIRLDKHNFISSTDIRLMRRMVRDYRTRGYSASATLENWMGMRGSEEENVYPYQREADIILNTSLAYEIGVLKVYVEPLLYSVPKDAEYYDEAIRILKFLRGFMGIPGEYVPNVSVLREFIGESYFE